MPFSLTTTPGRANLKLEGTITVRHAHELASGLSDCAEDGIAVDTGGLEDIDTCILQLFCSLRKTVRSLSFEDPSEAFLSAMDGCGLRRELLGTREGS